MQKQSYVVLGLDIGTTSVGWALVDLRQGEIVTGVQVFKDAEDESQTPRNKTRRDKRHVRRSKKRFKQRRKQLLTFLGVNFQELSALQTFGFTKAKQGEKPAVVDVDGAWNWLHEQQDAEFSEKHKGLHPYRLRAEALDRLLSPYELAIVLLHINRRRGFESNRKADITKLVSPEKEGGKGNEAASEETEDPKKINEIIEQLSAQIDPKKRGLRTAGEILWTKMLKELEEQDENSALLSRYRKQHIGRKNYRQEFNLIWEKQSELYSKAYPDEENPYSLSFKNEVEQRIIFYQRPLKSQRHTRLNCLFEPSKKVMPISHPDFQEFRVLQTIHNVRVVDLLEGNRPLNLEEKKKLLDEMNQVKSLSPSSIRKLLFGNSSSKKVNFEGDGNEHRLVGNKTRVEIEKALARRTLSKHDIYAIWHACHSAYKNSELKAHLEKGVKNTHEEKVLTFSSDEVNALLQASFNQDYARLSYKAVSSILPYMRLDYNHGGLDYASACAAAGYNHSSSTYNEPKLPTNKTELEEALKKLCLKKNELNNPRAQRSVSAAFRLIRSIYKRYVFADNAPYERIDEIVVENTRELRKPKEKRLKQKKSNDTIKRRREELTKFLKLQIKNGVINISNTEAESLEYIRKFELWLELNYTSKHEKVKGLTKEEVQDFMVFGKKLQGTKAKSLWEKYYLWMEADRFALLSSGEKSRKIISLSDLFSSEVEVEHIIPRSVSFNDSMMNKTLCWREDNAKKANRTPFEMYGADTKGKAWKDFQWRINQLPERFPNAKRKLLLSTQTASQVASKMERGDLLNSTAYIAVKTREHLSKITKTTMITGQMTSLLRGKWGLNSVLYEDGVGNEMLKEHPDFKKAYRTDDDGVIHLPTKKLRGDHRHHLIDAIVIACSVFHRNMSDAPPKAVRFYEMGKMRNDVTKEDFDLHSKTYANYQTLITHEGKRWRAAHINKKVRDNNFYFLRGLSILPPWKELRKDVLDAVNNVFVKHEKDKKHIITKRSSGDGVRGKLHLETFYGELTLPADIPPFKRGMKVRTKREDVALLSQEGVSRIIDESVRNAVQAFFNKASEEAGKGNKAPILWKLKKEGLEDFGIPHPGKKEGVFIKKVKVIASVGNNFNKGEGINRPKSKAISQTSKSPKPLSAKDVFSIVDAEERSAVIEYIAKHSAWNKQHGTLTQEHVKIAFKRVKSIPFEKAPEGILKKVNVHELGNNLIPIANKKYVASADTFACALYETTSGKKLKLQNLRLIDAALQLLQARRDGFKGMQTSINNLFPLNTEFEDKPYKKVVEFRKGDYFIVFSMVDIYQLSAQNKSVLSKILYRVNGFTHKNVSLSRHNVGSSHPYFKTGKNPPLNLLLTAKEMKTALKVELDSLGSLTLLSQESVRRKIEELLLQ